jgi:hypothetical protein
MEFSKDKHSAPSPRKQWPATRVAEGALDEDDFAGFNVCNTDTLH